MEFMGYPAYGTQDIVMGISAVAVNVALFLYPFPTICKILKHESTGNLQPYPYKAMEMASAIWMVYALPANGQIFTFNRFCLHIVNYFGLIFPVVYCLVFLRHTNERNAMIMRLFGAGELLFFYVVPIVLGHQVLFLSDCGNSKFFGPASIMFGLMMYASPIPAIMDAYKTRRTETLPFGFCALFSLNAVAWFSYAVFYPPTRDCYVAIANGGGIILGVVQLVLCFVLNGKLENSGATSEDSSPLLNENIP